MSTPRQPLIAAGSLNRQSMQGKVSLVTGAGGGIGFEAARALAWLGSRVIIAEINRQSGARAAEAVNRELGEGSAIFVHTDVGDERSVQNLKRHALKAFGKVDVVINNAAVAPLGAVTDVPIEDWDLSYRVNLRGPVLLARAFLPEMVQRRSGVFIAVSSVGLAYMGPYEILKVAQVELAKTLDAELEGSGVIAFTIGPGMVPTEALQKAVRKLAPLYSKTEAEFYEMGKGARLSIEEAGAGFAAAAALAHQFAGLEIGSLGALIAAGIDSSRQLGEQAGGLSPQIQAEAVDLCRRVKTTLIEQSQGWKSRPLFERQFMLRDFKNNAGMTVEGWLELLDRLEGALASGQSFPPDLQDAPLGKLAGFYRHLGDLARGYTRDSKALEEQMVVIRGWEQEVEKLAEILAVS